MSEAAPRRRRRIRGTGLACILLLGACALTHAAAQQNGPAPPAPLPARTPLPAVPVEPPPWDVSTVKPASPDARGAIFQITADGLKITGMPLWMMVREAFGLEDDRLFGGPAWAKGTAFGVEAKVSPEDAPRLEALTMEQRRQMRVALLEARFGLKYHHETRELPMYELVVAKGGVKMQASKPDPEGPDDGPGPEASPGRHMLMMHGRGHIESVGNGTAGLVRLLSAHLGRTVVDKTGLTGNYDFKLDWTPDNASSAIPKSDNPAAGDAGSSSESAGPSLFTALEEQLGLKLESTKGPVDVVVIDQLEQPTAN